MLHNIVFSITKLDPTVATKDQIITQILKIMMDTY